MKPNALIGAKSPLGKYLTGKMFFDFVFDDGNWMICHGKDFNHLVVICPSLWLKNDETCIENKKEVNRLLDILGDNRAEQITYITTLDLLPTNGDENSPLLLASDNPALARAIELRDLMEVKFGRVLTVRVPELLGLDTPYPNGLIPLLKKAKLVRDLKSLGLLTRHQFFPIEQLVPATLRAWDCGLSQINLVSEPLMTVEIVEKCFPKLLDKLPLARQEDAVGNMRKSIHAIHYYDPANGYMLDKEQTIECLHSAK